MPRFSVCVETFFSDLPYEDRIRRVAELGFSAYEFWFRDLRFNGREFTPEAKDFDRIAELNARHGLSTAAFAFRESRGATSATGRDAPASLIDPRDQPLLRDRIEVTIERAKRIGCPLLITGAGDSVAGLSRAEALDNLQQALSLLAPICRSTGITLLLEPFNSRVDHPGCFLDDPVTCVEVLRRVNSPNVKMLFDIYHMQIMHGDILSFVRQNLQYIGHFHVAGVPGRHEPSPSELDYRFILREIQDMGYTGYFGLEYWPSMDAGVSLRAARRALAEDNGPY
jgi:hydroxypyruvate isomerase